MITKSIKTIIMLTIVTTTYCWELPWQTVSIGIMGANGSSATFNSNNILYGLDVMTFGMDYEQEREEIGEEYVYDQNTGQYEWVTVYSGSDDISISACILMPRIGKRFNLKSVNRVHTYYQGEIYLAMPFLSIDAGDEETAEIEKDLKDLIDMLGFKVAYGVEYKFNEQLSFTIDVGFNYLINNIDIGGNDLQARIGNSYTKLSLNFTL